MLKKTEMLNRLPVPEIKEESFQYSIKQANRKDYICRLKPPKLKPRYDNTFNRSHDAYVISFRGEDTTNVECHSPMLNGGNYNSLGKETYFEQCFTCLAKIGEGSFGEVFKVRSKEDGLLYAVKMSKQLFRSELYRQERLEEVRRYEEFSGHANCVRFYRAWQQGERLYMQMELCRESLECYLERKRHIPENKIWSILLDLLLALKSLHDRNLLHLDIKLDNVLIGDDNSCKLADFGLVIDVDRANRHQATEGDSRYVAPEIMQGIFSKSADIFSLGIAMLELACNIELPANGPLWQQLRSGVLPQDFFGHISIELQQIIRQMMTPDPTERPTADQLLSNKKLITILQRRNQWLNKINQIAYKSKRFVWSKLCFLKNKLIQGLTSLIIALGLRSICSLAINHSKPMKLKSNEINVMEDKSATSDNGAHLKSHTAKTCSNHVTGSSECNEMAFDDSPYHAANSKPRLVNSTPVSFRSRKDLNKTSFMDYSYSHSFWERSTLDCTEDGFEDSCSHGSSFRKSHDISSLKGKKLFL